jgi:NADH:ubiquinone oxidoreductase subunit C
MAPDKDLVLEIANSVCEKVETCEHRDQLTLIVPKECAVELCAKLKAQPETSFDMLLDVTAIDRPGAENRFEVVYFLYSNKFKTRLRIKCALRGNNPRDSNHDGSLGKRELVRTGNLRYVRR